MTLDATLYVRGRIATLVIRAACLMCALPSTRLAAQELRSENDSIFATVVRALQADSQASIRRSTLVVDPRPLRPGNVDMVTDQTLAQVPSNEVERRLTILRSLGALPGDASFPPRCAGTLAPATPSDPTHAGCPAVSRLVSAVGLSRAADTSETKAAAAPSFRAVRVLVVGSAPSGITAEIRDYYLEYSHGAWRIVKMKVRGWYE